LSKADWSAVRGSTWANVVFLAIGPAAIAYLFYYRGLRSVSPVSATITLFSVPVFGTISSVLLLGESFTVVQLIGALITVAGALLAVIQTPSSRARSIGTSDSDTPQPHSEVRA
jgi:drug/metabolite transporter (DMT)-like permease